jgi:hypothetical protein
MRGNRDPIYLHSAFFLLPLFPPVLYWAIPQPFQELEAYARNIVDDSLAVESYKEDLMIQLGRSPKNEEDEEEEDEGVGSDESEEHVLLGTDNDGLPLLLLDKQPPSVWSCVQPLTLKYVAQKLGFPVAPR